MHHHCTLIGSTSIITPAPERGDELGGYTSKEDSRTLESVNGSKDGASNFK